MEISGNQEIRDSQSRILSAECCRDDAVLYMVEIAVSGQAARDSVFAGLMFDVSLAGPDSARRMQVNGRNRNR